VGFCVVWTFEFATRAVLFFLVVVVVVLVGWLVVV